MAKYDHFKKGVSCLHYTGTARQNIVDYTWLLVNSQTEEERKEHAKSLNYWITELADILQKIDKINDLN